MNTWDLGPYRTLAEAERTGAAMCRGHRGARTYKVKHSPTGQGWIATLTDLEEPAR